MIQVVTDHLVSYVAYMRQLFLALFAALFASPASAPVAPACPIEFSDTYSVQQPPGAVRARVYLFGSLNILSGQSFSDQLVAGGFQIVSLAVPQINPCLYVGDGTAYAVAVVAAIRSVVAKVDAQYGSAKSIIGGGSIGGLHAMMGYALVPGFAGWFASMPVTKLTALQEFVEAPEPIAFDPFQQIERFKTSTGVMSWGTADTRVDYRLAQQLYQEIGSPTVAGIEYVGLDHTTTPKQIDDLVSWINSHF